MVHIEIYSDRVGEYRWRLVATNNRIVAWSEGYTSKQGATQSAQWIQQWASSAQIVCLV